MNAPPLLPHEKKKSRTWIVFVVLGALVFCWIGYGVFKVYRVFANSGVASTMDQQFGDQYLKSAVALVELHKLRTGRYPERLADLRFIGQWDTLAVQNVRYIVAADGASYFVEVQRGWIGKPKLELPPEFWRGTGYNPKLAETK